ncbi:MAG TPA: PQQ-binding-like beta-propeller repeat protein, partial [Pirellulaceae bacterium]
MYVRAFRVDELESRRLLAIGDFVQAFDDSSTNFQAESEFGYSVATDGNWIAVGAPGDDLQGAPNVGRVHIYDRTSGNLVRTISNPTIATGDGFGRSVAISGDTLVVGCYLDDLSGTDSGTVYLFNASTGALITTIANPTPTAFDYFGYSVAVSGARIVVGAYLDDAQGEDAGVAYVFDAGTGALQRTLTSATAAAFDYFGAAVAISGDNVAVGVSRGDVGALDAGEVQIFN